ncbi:hypothetical protein [Nocardioides montaniterrae]
MTPMEYGQRVQDALRVLIEDRFADRESPVRSRAALSKALGHGEARQYVAGRFAPQGKDGKVRDLTVPDLIEFARALGLDGAGLLLRAQQVVESEEGARVIAFPVLSGTPPIVTDEELIGQPSVAEPPRVNVEGNEDPGD